jgi:hypothetical protein
MKSLAPKRSISGTIGTLAGLATLVSSAYVGYALIFTGQSSRKRNKEGTFFLREERGVADAAFNYSLDVGRMQAQLSIELEPGPTNSRAIVVCRIPLATSETRYDGPPNCEGREADLLPTTVRMSYSESADAWMLYLPGSSSKPHVLVR